MTTESKEITFPQGLIGFEDLTRFSLFQTSEDNPVIYTLQSIEDKNIAFSVVDPAVFGFNYELNLDDNEVGLLQASSAEDITTLLIVYRNPSSNEQINANLNAPVVLNHNTRIGLQKVLIKLNVANVTFAGI